MTFRRAVLLLAAIGLAPAALLGQAKLTVTGGPVAFAAPTIGDFDTGYIDAPSPLTYQVSLSGLYFLQNHTTTVAIRASSTTLNGSVPIGDLQWRRSDLTTWNPLTTANVNVESQSYRALSTQTPWTNQLFLRLNLSYAADTPGTYAATLVITLTVTSP